MSVQRALELGALDEIQKPTRGAANPAQPGETVQMYVSGMGALTTPVQDDFGATARARLPKKGT
jgi:uncharacterized protein (TIGR03437 family)